MDNVPINVGLFLNGITHAIEPFKGRHGVIHFIRFPTDRMMNFIRLVKGKGFAQLASTICATGGGAIKYTEEAEQVIYYF